MTQKYQVKVSMKQAAIVETGIVLKQGDFGMQIEIEVLDFDVTGTTPQIVFRKAMGAVESTTITVSSNKYTYTFKGTELDTPGKVFCDLKLKNSTTQRISTASFMFRVIADTMDGLAEESSSYSDTIAQIVGGFDDDIANLENSKLNNYVNIHDYIDGDGINAGGWFAYQDVKLKAGTAYEISFTKYLTFSGSLALCNSENEVVYVYSVTNDSIINLTPEEDVFPMFFNIPYGTTTDQPTTTLYRSTDPLEVGDTVTFDASWHHNTFNWGIRIKEPVSTDEIRNTEKAVAEIEADIDEIETNISNLDTNKLNNTVQLYHYINGDSINTGGWYAYQGIVLLANKKYRISFTNYREFTGSLALCGAQNKIKYVYSVNNSSIINITPSENVFPMFFGIPYATTTDQPTTTLYRSTDPLEVGDTVTFDASWHFDTLSHGIVLGEIIEPSEIKETETRVAALEEDNEESKIDIVNLKNNKLNNYVSIFEHTDGDGINAGGWFAYQDVKLKAGTAYEISFTKYLTFSGSLALCNSENEVVYVYSVTNDSIINLTPEEDVFPMFFNIPYETATDQPTTTLYRSTDPLEVGDTVTFDASWHHNTFSWGVDIREIYSIDDIVEMAENQKFIIVAKDGSGDYDSLAEAVAQEPSGTTIIVKPGTYDGSVRAFLKRINIIGTDRHKCIIRNTNGYYANPPLECCCGYVENLTFYAQYIQGTSEEIGHTSGAYAVHCENQGGGDIAEGDSLTFVNCDLISDFCPALGCGTFKDWNLQLINCRLVANQEDRGVYISDGTLGALYIHDMNGNKGQANIYVQDCIIENKSGDNTMCLYDLDHANVEMIFEFVNNTIFSATNKFTDSIWWRGITEPFANNFELSEISHGNTGSVLNN